MFDSILIFGLFAVQNSSIPGKVDYQQRNSKRLEKYLDGRWISLRQSRQDQLHQIDQLKKTMGTLKNFKFSVQSSSVWKNLELQSNICKTQPYHLNIRGVCIVCSHYCFFKAELAGGKVDLKQILDCLELFGSSGLGTSSEKGHPRQGQKPQAQLEQETPDKADDSEPMNKWHRMLSQSERDAIIAVFKFVDTSENNSLVTNKIRDVMRILRLDTAGTLIPHPPPRIPDSRLLNASA